MAFVFRRDALGEATSFRALAHVLKISSSLKTKGKSMSCQWFEGGLTIVASYCSSRSENPRVGKPCLMSEQVVWKSVERHLRHVLWMTR